MTESATPAASNVTFGNNTYKKCLPYDAHESISDQVVMTAGYVILFIFSLIGNIVVITAFFKQKKELRTPVQCFLVNMAVSDLFVPLFVIPRRIKQIYHGWGTWLIAGVLEEILCKSVNFADEVSVTVSSQSMVFIAAERFWAIVFPMRSFFISSEKITSRVICFTWISSTIFFFYYFFAYKLDYEGKRPFCGNSLPQLFDTRYDLWRVDRLSLLAIFVLLPFFLMIGFYVAIIRALYLQGKTAVHLSSAAQQRRTRENKNVTLMLVVVVILFFVSWTPYYIYFFLYYYELGSNWSCVSLQRLRLGSKYMNYIYTAANPLIYYIFNATFRRRVRQLLICFRHHGVQPEVSMESGPTVTCQCSGCNWASKT